MGTSSEGVALRVSGWGSGQLSSHHGKCQELRGQVLQLHWGHLCESALTVLKAPGHGFLKAAGGHRAQVWASRGRCRSWEGEVVTVSLGICQIFIHLSGLGECGYLGARESDRL